MITLCGFRKILKNRKVNFEEISEKSKTFYGNWEKNETICRIFGKILKMQQGVFKERLKNYEVNFDEVLGESEDYYENCK